MPQILRKAALLEKIVQSIHEAGWNVLYVSDKHPFRLNIYKGEESIPIRIYIWNISHGGGPARPENEYRIQVTGLNTNQFVQTTNVKTLILGYWQESDVFAGFDYRKHSSELGFSPSFQIRKQCLETAVESGFAPCDKGNQEIAIAFRPDFFVEYVRQLEQLHDFGQSSEDLAALEAVITNPEINDEEIEVQNTARRTAIRTVRQRIRDASFRRKILRAYNHRCAVCGVQLNLVEAAHIIPVFHENSTDETRNGLALCPLHHQAYDQALFTVLEDYTTTTNTLKIMELQTLNLGGGLEDFLDKLLPTIQTPISTYDYPHVEYIRIGNQVRGWI